MSHKDVACVVEEYHRTHRLRNRVTQPLRIAYIINDPGLSPNLASLFYVASDDILLAPFF